MGKNKDFIGQSDSWASWLQRIKEIIDGDRAFWGWTLMTFASSFIAPIKSILGLPLTIILFTGAGAAIFLIVSLLWKEFNHKRELKKEEEISDIKLNCDRAKKIDGILIRATNSKPAEQIQLYNHVMVLTRDFPEIKKQRTIEVARKVCGENVTQEQQSTIYTLLEKYEPFRDKVNELLATKGLEAIKKNLLSKQSVEFLSSITDEDLEILKRQFRYVLRLPHLDVSQDLGIYNYDLSIDDKYDLGIGDNLQNILLKENGLIHLESYYLRFFGDVWIGEIDSRAGFYKINGSHVIGDIDSKKRWNLQIETKVENAQEHQILFRNYACLSQIGIEIFNLLKDELEPTPSEYLNKLVEYLAKFYPAVTFTLMEKTQLLENDNS